MTMTKRNVLNAFTALALLSVATFGFTETAQADATKIKIAYLQADSMLPALYANDKGYFKDANLEPDFIPVQGGPAVVAAVASGEADIGYAALVPPINGHINGVPVKIFLQLGKEAEPDKKFVRLVASKASGIADLAGVKGKKFLSTPMVDCVNWRGVITWLLLALKLKM